MLKRLPIVVATLCFVSITASAESIAFRRDQDFVSHARTLAALSKPFSASHAIPGDLGKAFANRERLLPTVPGSGTRSNEVSAAIPAHPLNSGLSLIDYRGSPAAFVKQRSLLNSILGSLFQHLPHGNSRRN